MKPGTKPSWAILEVPLGKYAQVYTFREGLIVHWKLYQSQAEALAAAGLAA